MECHLLRFGENVVHVAIEGHLPDDLDRYIFFRPQLGRIQYVEVEVEFVFLLDELNAKFEFRIVSVLDGFIKIAAMEVRILPVDLLCFIPHKGMCPEDRLPVELHKVRLPFIVDKAERMDAKALHHAETSGNGTIRHGPHDHMRRFLVVGDEIPECIMG